MRALVDILLIMAELQGMGVMSSQVLMARWPGVYVATRWIKYDC